MNRFTKYSLTAQALTASPLAHAATATLTGGYIGGYETNSNGANRVEALSTYGITSVVINDGNTTALFQGNDTSVTVEFFNGATSVAKYDGANQLDP